MNILIVLLIVSLGATLLASILQELVKSLNHQYYLVKDRKNQPHLNKYSKCGSCRNFCQSVFLNCAIHPTEVPDNCPDYKFDPIVKTATDRNVEAGVYQLHEGD